MTGSSLPSELWRSIFRYAVYVPHLFDVNWAYEPEETLWEGWNVVKDSQAVTRRAITQVCREWKELGSEFLHEFIEIPVDEEEEFGHLLASFKASEMASRSKIGYGWWTKRIDCPVALFMEGQEGPLLSILDLCHNLQIFSVPGVGMVDTSVQIRVARLLETRFRHSLRRVDLLLQGDELDPTMDYAAVLPDVRLQSLGMTIREPYLPHSLHPSLEGVTTLTLFLPAMVPDDPLPVFFPRLTTLALTQLGTGDIPSIRPFINNHDKTLANVYVHEGAVSISSIYHLISGCVSIKTLTFHQTAFRSVPLSKVDGTSVQYLGILCLSAGIKRSQLVAVERLVSSGAFADLRAIRLLGITNPILSHTADWEKAIEHCGVYRVKLQDVHGRSIVVRKELKTPGVDG